MNEDSPAPLPSSDEKIGIVRPHDWVVGASVALLYFVVWLLTPAEWGPFPSGGKGFLLVFVPMAGAAAMLGSVFLTTPGLRSRDYPAIWLGIQVVFWNPLAFCAVVALAEAIGVPSGYGTVVGLVALLMLGLPTSLFGCVVSNSPSWIATYAARGLQCLLTGIPLFPPLLFLHVVVLTQAVTWERYERLNGLAVTLLVVEQTAALLWFFLFSGFEFAAAAT